MYQAAFQLNERPFSISPDPRFLYLAPQHKETLSKCVYMIANKVGPVFVTGPIGSGKTTVARRLYQQFQDDPAFATAMLIAPNLKTANAFLRTIMQEFEVKTARSYDQSLRNFSEFLKAQAERDMFPILLVDEAQNLPRDVLRLMHFLLNYETNSQKLLQVVLFGQMELAVKIERFPELKSRMFPGALASLTKEDMAGMIGFRWQVAGGKEHPFSAEALEEIFKYSLGLPREICKLCDLALLKAFSEDSRTVSAETIAAAAEELKLAPSDENRDVSPTRSARQGKRGGRP